jgi:hypothetical protein
VILVAQVAPAPRIDCNHATHHRLSAQAMPNFHLCACRIIGIARGLKLFLMNRNVLNRLLCVIRLLLSSKYSSSVGTTGCTGASTTIINIDLRAFNGSSLPTRLGFGPSKAEPQSYNYICCNTHRALASDIVVGLCC